MGKFKELAPPVVALAETLKKTYTITEPTRNNLTIAAKDRIYGPYAEDLIDFGRRRIEAGHAEPIHVVRGLDVAATLYNLASRRYGKDHKGRRALSGNALAQHQARVRQGTIEFLPNQVSTSCEEGRAQVDNGNTYLAGDTKVEAELAALNYGAFFKKETMAGATRTLDRHEIDELLELMNTNPREMPHLSVSNWAIGQTVAGIYEYAAKTHKRLRIIDIGSGHGATLAAITNSIQNVDVDQRPGIATTTLETTPEFYAELTAFAERDTAASDLGLDRIRHNSTHKGSISEFGALTTVNADAISVLKDLDISRWDGENEIVVITANYAFHRLPEGSKDEILRKFAHVPNFTAIVGDLAENTSEINRRYFNLAANGPLNCGNRRLTQQFKYHGYNVVDLAKEKPSALDMRLARRINREHIENDGHLWIAHRGAHAKQALDLLPQAA